MSTGSQEAEDDILDLTNELVFADSPRDTELANAEEAGESKQAVEESKHPGYLAPATQLAAYDKPISNFSGVGQPSKAPSVTDAGPASPSTSRPLWSRRAFPRRDTRARPAELTRETAPLDTGDKARRAPDAGEVKNGRIDWPQDIQLPVPEQGPVPLMEQLGSTTGSGSRSSPPSPSTSRPEGNIAGPEGRSSQAGGGIAAEEKAVAALARTLANAAAAGLQDDELADARDVDFQHLPDERKTEVSSKFADAMRAEHPPLRPELFAPPYTAGRGEARFRPAPAKPFSEAAAPSRDASFEPTHRTLPPSTSEDRIEPRDLPDAGSLGTGGAGVGTLRFPGATSTASSATAPGTLEDLIREMLRPMLVQWLNEHMPRILENAIREEITKRGLVPRGDASWEETSR
jgi:cell pole-organizing protein PopZ